MKGLGSTSREAVVEATAEVTLGAGATAAAIVRAIESEGFGVGGLGYLSLGSAFLCRYFGRPGSGGSG